MTITFYNVTDAPNVVNKTLGEPVYTITNARPITDCNVLNPTLIMSYTNTIASANYVKIAEFGNRYYFITNVTLMSGGRCAISCNVDVLKTYASAISACSGVCIRSESAGKTFIVDNKYPIDDTKKYVEMVKYPETPFTRIPLKPFILTTIGGVNYGS